MGSEMCIRDSSEGDGEAGGDEDVEPSGAPEKARLPDDLRHLLVSVRHRGDVCVSGIRLAYRSERGRGLFDL